MMGFSCSLLALAAGMTIAGQLASAHKIRVERLGNQATYATGFTFEADFNGTVGDCKQGIAAMYQVPVEKLYVFWMGNSQPDSFNLARFVKSPNEDRQPSLVIDANLIKVVTPDGSDRYFVVEESDTIADLKKKIDRREDIPANVQRLMRGNEELQDSARLANLLTGDGSGLRLVEASGQRIRVERLGNHATYPTGYSFRGNFSGSVGELKQRVATAYQVPLEKVHVFWMGNSQPDSFNLDRFASSANFDRQPTVAIDADLIKIVKPDGSSRVVAAEGSDTIAELKRKIDRLDEIPAATQRLMRGDRELDNGELISSLLSEEGTVLRLAIAPGQQIKVERLGDHATIATGFSFGGAFRGSVGELKQRVAAAYQVPLEKVHVFWMGNSQPDSFNLDRFSSSMSYDRQPTIAIDAHLIKVAKPDGRHIVVAAEKSDTIADLKKKIDKLEDIPTIVQRLMKGDQELQDSEQVAGLLSEDGTVFKLVVQAKED